jgi:selenocysteine lyase/cysteine desulfurase
MRSTRIVNRCWLGCTGRCRDAVSPRLPRQRQHPALIAFTRDGLKTQFGDRLAQAQVAVTVDDHRLRISPSLFNDDKDIDALLNALS